MTVKKKFDKALYDVADKKAKEVMINWLKNNTKSTEITMKVDTYFDITCSISPELPRQLYEVEIKYSWKGDWPKTWREIRIPYRKKRLLDKWKKDHYNDTLTFVVLREDCKQAWFFDGDMVLNSEVKEVSNRNIRKGEMFFHLKTTDGYIVDID
jgi:aminopeptidase N